MTTKLEAQLPSGEWADLTRYVQSGGEHAPDWGPPFPDPMQPRRTRKQLARIPGPRRVKRTRARARRVAALPHLLESTEGTGNPMVNLCRSGTQQSARDRAARLKGGDGQAPPMQPNDRLRHFGIRAVIGEDGWSVLVGGTARQRACYRRAVDRWMYT